jgi:hypothetical protein
MSNIEIADLENDVKVEITEKPKKERSEKQKQAMQKMQEGRQKKALEQLELKALREEKQKQEEDIIKGKLLDKMTKKVINYKKKHITKAEIINAVSDDDESVGIERKHKTPKETQPQPIPQPQPQPIPQPIQQEFIQQPPAIVSQNTLPFSQPIKKTSFLQQSNQTVPLYNFIYI